MSGWHAAVDALLHGGEDARIRALRSLAEEEEFDWFAVEPYFERILHPGSDAGTQELGAAIDLALHLPLRSVHSMMRELALQGEGEERLQALSGLARLGEPVGAALVHGLAESVSPDVRSAVAEHLLLVDVDDIKGDLSNVLQREEDPEVRFWVASALARAGEPEALTAEIQSGRAPESLVGEVVKVLAVEGEEADTEEYVVEPRMEPVEPPGFIDVAMAEPPDEVGAEGGGPRMSMARPPTPETPGVEVREGNGAEMVEANGGGRPGAEPAPRPRYFEGRAPDRVKLADTIGVQLRVALASSGGGPSEAISLDVPEEGIRLSITALTPGFELAGGSQLQELDVPADADSDWSLYRLRAMREGVHDLVFTLFHPEGRMLGELAIQVSVDALAETSASREVRAGVTSVQGDEGEVSLTIDWIDDQSVYKFQLVDRSMPEEVLTERLQRPPRELVESLIDRFDLMARNRHGGGNIRAELKDHGVLLWNELVPKRLQEQFWERQSRITSLRILTRDDPIPWEILYPLSGSSDAGFLVEQFPVVRGIRGASPVEKLGDGPLETVVPSTGAPTKAAEEAEMVRALWAERQKGDVISQLEPLRTLLQRGTFGILHLACHNAFDAEDPARTSIKLGTETFAPVVLAPARATQALAGGRPLVFMNACRSGGQAALYTNQFGWATEFMGAGAGGFVGSQWAVRDSSARTFAQSFYEAMRGGANLGKSLMAARDAIKNDDDPTWLAYAAYGDPRATI